MSRLDRLKTLLEGLYYKRLWDRLKSEDKSFIEALVASTEALDAPAYYLLVRDMYLDREKPKNEGLITEILMVLK